MSSCARAAPSRNGGAVCEVCAKVKAERTASKVCGTLFGWAWEFIATGLCLTLEVAEAAANAGRASERALGCL